MARVLVVDDERSIRLTLREFLREEGHDVAVAEDADTALDVLKQHGSDVVVSDIVLPRVTGVELLRALREAAPTVQVIMMTGDPSLETAAESVRMGAADYLVKPVGRAAIVRAVASAAKVKAVNDECRRLEAENRTYQANLERLVQERTAALRESEDQYRQLVDHSPDGIAIQSDGRIVFANAALAQILHCSVDDIRGKPISAFCHPDAAKGAGELAATVPSSGAPVLHSEAVFVAADGGPLQVALATSPLVHQGRPAVQLIIRDITQQRRLEAQVRQSQKLEAIGHLAGGVAHDFNNLLMVIMGCAQFVEKEIPVGSPALADLRELQAAGRRAEGLTRQLLAFSRKQTLSPALLDLSVLVANLQKMLGRLLGEDIELCFLPSHDVGCVTADPGQVEQVIMNLAINARDAMPSGGTLTIRTGMADLGPDSAPLFVDPSGLVPGPYATITVSDSGTGMSKAVRDRIFEPFFTTKRPGEGTGLGLATVYGIVQQHHGFLSLDSQEGKGTTFVVYFPVTREPGTAVTGATGDKASLPGGRERILFVEDDAKVRYVGARMARSLGYSVLEACGAEDAIRVAAACPGDIDLLISDIIMPGMAGPELAQRIAQARPNTKVLFVSGYTGDRLAKHGLSLAAASVLAKPFDEASLARRIREVLER
jgi:PAS domain S-box-containing protein